MLSSIQHEIAAFIGVNQQALKSTHRLINRGHRPISDLDG